MKRELYEQMRAALELCGYDFDEVINAHCRKRYYTDLRSIIFDICEREKGLVASQMGEIFGWNRSTVHCSLKRAKSLYKYDRAFSNTYDAIYGAYMTVVANGEAVN